jgi:cobalt-zinc-cadmium efflux system protein
VPADFGKIFAISAGLNFAIVILQVIYGLRANSVALLADAGHNFGDMLGLLLAWGAHTLARVLPTTRFTYGMRSASILAALANGLLLMLATGAIVLEAIQRFFNPEPVASITVMIVATVGIVANVLSALLLMKGGKEDLNIRGAFLHMVADAAVSVGVVIAALAILFTGWVWLDPLMSLVISIVIVWGTWGLLRESVMMSLDAVPPSIDPAKVSAFLKSRPGVTDIHDLHIWAIGTTETALTCHLIMPDGHPGDSFLQDTCQGLREQLRISHATLQIEVSDAGDCAYAAEHAL